MSHLERNLACMNAKLASGMPLAPQIYKALRRAIIAMELKPGQNLSEKEIALQMGVSRQPVREAFIKLSETGLVQILPQRGTYVVGISMKLVLQARFIREALELALILAATGKTDAEFEAKMAHIMSQQATTAANDDWANFLKWDDAFHQAFAEFTGWERVWKVIEAEKAQMDRVRHLSYSGQTRMELLIEQHQAILDCVIAGDRGQAEKAVRLHFEEILSSMPAIAKEHGDLFDDVT